MTAGLAVREDERPFGARGPKALLRERGQLLAYKGEHAPHQRIAQCAPR